MEPVHSTSAEASQPSYGSACLQGIKGSIKPKLLDRLSRIRRGDGKGPHQRPSPPSAHEDGPLLSRLQREIAPSGYDLVAEGRITDGASKRLAARVAEDDLLAQVTALRATGDLQAAGRGLFGHHRQ